MKPQGPVAQVQTTLGRCALPSAAARSLRAMEHYSVERKRSLMIPHACHVLGSDLQLTRHLESLRPVSVLQDVWTHTT